MKACTTLCASFKPEAAIAMSVKSPQQQVLQPQVCVNPPVSSVCCAVTASMVCRTCIMSMVKLDDNVDPQKAVQTGCWDLEYVM